LEDKVLIWVVSKDKFIVVPSIIEAEKLTEKVETYLKLLPKRGEAEQAEARRLERELYILLVEPVVNELDRSGEICVIPHKILFHLPFAALLSANGNYFLEEFNIFYAPSANIFILCTENAQKKAGLTNEELLAVGNPAFSQQEFEDLSDLPAAKIEAREIARFYEKEELLLGEAATKEAFRNSLRNAEVIHFAGHYLVAQHAPLASSLLLAGRTGKTDESVLTNAELIREKLPRAKLIVLSACQTGIENFYNGEGLIGLSRTFLAAGAPLVVASQWKVDSDATAQLMKRFHYYRREEKLSTTTALRRAQLEMLETDNGRFRQPYFWAAFATFGGYAEF
jgi:CHAT domain-containing protein